MGRVHAIQTMMLQLIVVRVLMAHMGLIACPYVQEVLEFCNAFRTVNVMMVYQVSCLSNQCVLSTLTKEQRNWCVHVQYRLGFSSVV
jgi:hypothetical protein